VASTSQVRAPKAKKGTSPISAHPAFPLVVALWFAALLGLGSLVMPVGLFERLATATGIADIFPAAAPPLGVTARIAIALAATLIGAVLGLFAARLLARPQPEQARRRTFKSGENARRLPVNPREELGSDSFDSVADFSAGRRRALAGEEEVRKSDLFQAAPLPGQGHGHGFAYSEDALDLDECAEFTEVDEADLHDVGLEEETVMTAKQVISFDPDGAEPLPFSPPSLARHFAVDVPTPPEAAGSEHTEIEFADFEPESVTQPPAIAEPEATPQEELPISPFAALAEPDADAAQGPQPDLVQLVQKLGATLEKHREWAAQRKSLPSEAPQFPRAVAVAEFAAPDFAETGAKTEIAREFGLAAPAEAAQAMAAFFAPEPDLKPEADVEEFGAAPAMVPISANSAAASQLRPFAGMARVEHGGEEEDEEDLDRLAASFSLPFSRAEPVLETASAEAPAFEADGGEDGSAPDGENYSSLLAIKNPFRDHRPEFVRVEEPEPETALPAVMFPNEDTGGSTRAFDRPAEASIPAPAEEIPAPSRPAISSEDNDRVLREALMNLQRIAKN